MYSNNNQLDPIYDNVDKQPPLNFNNYTETNEAPFQNQVLMPQPPDLPWKFQGVPWGIPGFTHPQLVQFTAQSQENSPPKSAGLSFPFKRKSNFEEYVPTKQLKTDEVMAAHLNGLHISKDYTSHGATNQMNENQDEAAKWLKDDKNSNYFDNNLKNVERIVLSDEVKSFRADSILPDTLLRGLDKPCMSLVLWKPPERLLRVPQHNSNSENLNRNDKHFRRSVLRNVCDMDLDL